MLRLLNKLLKTGVKTKEKISLEDFRREMEGVYSTSVNESTIDESPMAYRRLSDIAPVIEPTAEIIERGVSEVRQSPRGKGDAY